MAVTLSHSHSPVHSAVRVCHRDPGMVAHTCGEGEVGQQDQDDKASHSECETARATEILSQKRASGGCQGMTR